MKECEWCGDDFRGEGVVLDGHYFCSENCRDEFRKDVFDGDESQEDAAEREGKSS